MEKIEITTLSIKLDQFLKFTGIAQTGGHASMIIEEGNVIVNGEVCNQRGKKLIKDDVVQIGGDEYRII